MPWFRRSPKPSPPNPPRPWPVSACGVLLTLQALGFGALAWLEAPPSLQAPFAELWLPGSFAMLALAALADSLSLLRLRPGAWSFANLLQSLALGLALWLYFNPHPGYVYPLMLFGVLVVAYLNHPVVRHAFPQEPLFVEADTPEGQP